MESTSEKSTKDVVNRFRYKFIQRDDCYPIRISANGGGHLCQVKVVSFNVFLRPFRQTVPCQDFARILLLRFTLKCRSRLSKAEIRVCYDR